MPDRPAPQAPSLPDLADLVVIGAGIVGLATARSLLQAQPGARIVVIDKEASVAAHQTGHNSGVIHAGLSYVPGSAKARLCLEGRAQLMAWCDRHDVTWERCGKVVVATTPEEVVRLDALEARATQNGVATTRLDGHGLAEHEPHARGLAALHVPSTAIVDFGRVARVLASELEAQGVTIALGTTVGAIERRSSDVIVSTDRGRVRAGRVANCAGLASDRVAAAAGDEPGVAIMPFRGEYHELVPGRRSLVRNLIYPVPDPRYPFLGVHLTRTIDGRIHAGPNAVLALSREGYRWRDISPGDLWSMASDRASWRLARDHWRTGVEEVTRSASRARLVRSLQRLVPELTGDDLVRSGSGVRAQAVGPDGGLLDDFAFAGDDRIVHVLNAPSPAATASLAIGDAVAARLLTSGSRV